MWRSLFRSLFRGEGKGLAFSREGNMIRIQMNYELTKWPAPRWLDSLVGRALQRSWVRIPFRPEFVSGFNFTTA